MSREHDPPLSDYDRRAIRGWFKSMQAAVPGLVDELFPLAEDLTYEALLPVIYLYDYLLRYGDAAALSRFDLEAMENCPEDLACELARIIIDAKRRVFLYEAGMLRAYLDRFEALGDVPEEHPGYYLYDAAFNRVIDALAFLAMQLPEGRQLVDLRNAEAGREIFPPFTKERAKRLPRRGHLRLVVSN